MHAFDEAVGRDDLEHASRRLEHRRVVADPDEDMRHGLAGTLADAFDERLLADGIDGVSHVVVLVREDWGVKRTTPEESKRPALPCGEVA